MSGKKTPEQVAWTNMRQRCANKNAKSYSRYGGRGIKVCEAWQGSFKAFLRDMGKKPTPNHSVDRIDNSGDYEPSNCRWATHQEQNLNQRIRCDNPTGFVGVRQHACGKFEAYINHNKKQHYIGLYETAIGAVIARNDHIQANNLPHKLESISPKEEA